MKKLAIVLSLVLFGIGSSYSQWAPAGDKIKTRWAKDVDPTNVLPEYPRPFIERSEWSNLNGLWQYAIRPVGEAEPQTFDGNILVPFAIESSLSGVMKTVSKENELWYKRNFTVPASWKGKNVILNFGAVDWRTEVIVNGIAIGSHEGGYTPFSFDITPYLQPKGEQTLVVRVWDPSSEGYQPCGKQSTNPSGIWYTSVTGIWQTVWIEPVKPNYVTDLKTVPNLDGKTIDFTVAASDAKVGDFVTIEVMDNGKLVSSAKGVPGNSIRVPIANPKLWSPADPFLYDVKVTLTRNGQVMDQFKSYAAMRKISCKKDENGFNRIALNDEVIFNFGPLDQGWWPDGLYTAPTDEALVYDIKKTIDFGFNMIRKHVKVEPARWYYHCDRLGMLVWQDMPSGNHRIGRGGEWNQRVFGAGRDKPRTQESKDNYYAEWKEIMDFCYSFPSVVVWVPFNEAWGQFDTEEVAAWTKNYDKSRLVNSASGGNFRDCGDILDIHHYPAPAPTVYIAEKINVIGEYGGIGLPQEGHLWVNTKNWGYVQFKSIEDVSKEYVKYAQKLKPMISMGYSGAVYTQTTDVEIEVNGLMTYDREIIKVNESDVKNVNQEVIKFGNVK